MAQFDTAANVEDTDSVEWFYSATEGGTEPRIRQINNTTVGFTDEGIERGGDSGLYSSPQGMWVEPHPIQPSGFQELKTFGAASHSTRYAATYSIFNPDAYDKTAFFTLCGILEDVPMDVTPANGDDDRSSLGHHVLQFGFHDEMTEVARQSFTESHGIDRQGPSCISTIPEPVVVPAGTGMENRVWNGDFNADGTPLLVISGNANPGAPPLMVARFQQYWLRRYESSQQGLGGNHLIWSMVMA